MSSLAMRMLNARGQKPDHGFLQTQLFKIPDGTEKEENKSITKCNTLCLVSGRGYTLKFSFNMSSLTLACRNMTFSYTREMGKKAFMNNNENSSSVGAFFDCCGIRMTRTFTEGTKNSGI